MKKREDFTNMYLNAKSWVNILYALAIPWEWGSIEVNLMDHSKYILPQS